MFLTMQNYKEECFYLVREYKNVLRQSESKKSPKSVVTRSSNVSSSTSYGYLPHQACLVHQDQQYALDNRLLSHPKAACLIGRTEAVGFKHYIAVPGRRYKHSVYPAI